MNDHPHLTTITLQYLLYVGLASLGVLQLAAARAGRSGLLLLPARSASALLGAGLLATGYASFFASARFGERGLEGAQLSGYFGIGALAALALCRFAGTARAAVRTTDGEAPRRAGGTRRTREGAP